MDASKPNLATIQRVRKLTPIPGMDRIESAQILGWNLIVRKEDFHEGDLCVYIEPDTVVPENSPFKGADGKSIFEFLRPKKFQVNTMKMHGAISEGIAFPLATFGITDGTEGADVTEKLGITHYMKWDDSNYGLGKVTCLRPFPKFCPQTDETALKRIPEIVARHLGEWVYVTEKIDGTSATFYVLRQGDKTTLGICSRAQEITPNLDRPYEELSVYEKVAVKYALFPKLQNKKESIAIQGEIIGPKVNKNPYRVSDVEFYVHNIYFIDETRHAGYLEMNRVAKELELKVVPELCNGVLETRDVDVAYWVALAHGHSAVNPNELREGIVVRGVHYIPDFATGRFSFKVVDSEYDLKWHARKEKKVASAEQAPVQT